MRLMVRTSDLTLIADTPWSLNTRRMKIDLTNIAKGPVTSKSANQKASRWVPRTRSVRCADNGDSRNTAKDKIDLGGRSSYEIVSNSRRSAATLRRKLDKPGLIYRILDCFEPL